MRMWMVKPELLCNQHLLGEHFEIHKALGNLNKTKTWTKSLTEKGFLEPQHFHSRHNIIVKEMQKRNINHNSPLKDSKIKIKGKVDVKRSIKDLKSRCKDCRKKWKNSKQK